MRISNTCKLSFVLAIHGPRKGDCCLLIYTSFPTQNAEIIQNTESQKLWEGGWVIFSLLQPTFEIIYRNRCHKRLSFLTLFTYNSGSKRCFCRVKLAIRVILLALEINPFIILNDVCQCIILLNSNGSLLISYLETSFVFRIFKLSHFAERMRVSPRLRTYQNLVLSCTYFILKIQSLRKIYQYYTPRFKRKAVY